MEQAKPAAQMAEQAKEAPAQKEDIVKPAEKEVTFPKNMQQQPEKAPASHAFLETSFEHGLPQRAKQVAPGHVVVSKESKTRKSQEDLEDDEMIQIDESMNKEVKSEKKSEKKAEPKTQNMAQAKTEVKADKKRLGEMTHPEALKKEVEKPEKKKKEEKKELKKEFKVTVPAPAKNEQKKNIKLSEKTESKPAKQETTPQKKDSDSKKK